VRSGVDSVMKAAASDQQGRDSPQHTFRSLPIFRQSQEDQGKRNILGEIPLGADATHEEHVLPETDP
jgi:hypothetical protein